MFQLFKKIPVTVTPTFLLVAAFLGWSYANYIPVAIICMVIIFISVLFHELGHAITAYLFGKRPTIALVAFGGVTNFDNRGLKLWQQFLIVLNGPLFGIVLFLIAKSLLLFEYKNPHIFYFLSFTAWINLFWSLINLLPFMPLDGGQLSKIVFEKLFGFTGIKISFILGFVLSLALTAGFFMTLNFLPGAIVFLFAIQNLNLLNQARKLTKEDTNREKASLLQKGEEALRLNQKEEAKTIFEKVKNITKKGVLHSTAVQYLAFLKLEEGQKNAAYKLFLEAKEGLSDEAKCLLHGLAFEEKDFYLVSEFSSVCYQLTPTFEVALKNAKAFAGLNQPRPSGGWLQTASQFPNFNLEEILKEDVFKNILNTKEFKKLLSQIKIDK